MQRTFLRRPSPALVVAVIALFVALSGSAYAVATINGGSIVNRSIVGKKLKLDTVKGSEIREASLAKVPQAAHADGATAADTAATANSAGVAGNANALGGLPPAAFMPSRLDYNVSAAINNPSGTQSSGFIACDAGMRAVGGGVFSAGGHSDTQLINSSSPSGTTGWVAWVDNYGPSDRTFRVYVICASATQVTKAKGLDAAVK